jgi:initiation factor 1A
MASKSNKLGGKKHKRGKKHNEEDNLTIKLILAKESQVYAIVKKRLGCNRLTVECSDKITRNAIIPGKFYKRVWINVGDTILCDISSNEKDDCIVNHKYSSKNIAELRSLNKINFDMDENFNNDIDIFYDNDDDDDN